ncbi:MAG: acetolactate synthase large subunit [Gemmatimonadota bacterium]
MRGADSLMRSLAESGIEICFANPGTSELHLVAGLDAAPGVKAVLTLHENVASGAADGWGRIRGRPASTLLHLGPGLSNALSNLHNARRGATPIVNIVGDHASYHVANDPPLASDIAALARTVSGWVYTVPSAQEAELAGRAAVAAAAGPPGAIATLIVPADAAWGEVAATADAATDRQEQRSGTAEASTGVSAVVLAGATRAPYVVLPGAETHGVTHGVARAAAALASGEPAMLLVGGRAMAPELLALAGQVAARTGAQLCCTPFTARARRGAGSVAVDRLPYFPELVTQRLAGVRHLLLLDAPAPVAFFAYPGQSTALVPSSCVVQSLVSGGADVREFLEALVARTDAGGSEAALVQAAIPSIPHGSISPAVFAQTLAAVLPEEAIVCDEAISNRFPAMLATIGARPHDWCCITGGSLGSGIPMALGAALAAPGRRVLNLQADGSAMYTPQALWSLAREGVDVTTVILANRRYRILDVELERLQLTDIDRGRALTDLSHPSIDFVQLAMALGVPALRVDQAGALADAMQRAFAEPGPCLIEAAMVA